MLEVLPAGQGTLEVLAATAATQLVRACGRTHVGSPPSGDEGGAHVCLKAPHLLKGMHNLLPVGLEEVDSNITAPMPNVAHARRKP